MSQGLLFSMHRRGLDDPTGAVLSPQKSDDTEVVPPGWISSAAGFYAATGVPMLWKVASTGRMARLQKSPKPMAIFAPSDVTCVHVMQCAQNLGLRVPEEAAILSANNDELICDFAPVPLSSIRLNFTQWGFEAAVLLDKLMNGRAPSQPVPAIPPGSVVSRQSTNILLVPDEQVAQAMRYIWKNLSRPLPIQEIADHVGISHPTLGRLFRKHLRRSVSDEIMLARLDKAKQMLTFQKMPIQDIATACGFNTPNYFNNVFHKSTGVTPRKFRITADPATAISRPDFVSLSPSMAEKK